MEAYLILTVEYFRTQKSCNLYTCNNHSEKYIENSKIFKVFTQLKQNRYSLKGIKNGVEQNRKGR